MMGDLEEDKDYHKIIKAILRAVDEFKDSKNLNTLFFLKFNGFSKFIKLQKVLKISRSS